VKAAHDHWNTQHAKPVAEVESPWILLGLNADQPDHAAAGSANALRHASDVDDGVAFVAGFNLNMDVGAEDAIPGALFDQAIKR
jgi:hypothetical protein